MNLRFFVLNNNLFIFSIHLWEWNHGVDRIVLFFFCGQAAVVRVIRASQWQGMIGFVVVVILMKTSTGMSLKGNSVVMQEHKLKDLHRCGSC
jgi:hypothetical protein